MKNISFAFIQEWFKGLFNRNKKESVLENDVILLKRKGQIISMDIDNFLQGYTSDEELESQLGQISSILSRLNTIYVSTIEVTSAAFINAASSNANALKLTPSVPNKRVVPLYVNLSCVVNDLSITGVGGNNYFVVGTQPLNSGSDYIFYLPQANLSITSGSIDTRFIDGAGKNNNPLGSALFLYGTNSNTNSGFTPTIQSGTISNIRITTYYALHG